jgi:Lar family restriction alleviation protein
MEELKPCPFCGGKARIRKLQKLVYAVRCTDCGATSTSFGVKPWHDTVFIAQGQAIEAWNRRTHENR